MIRYHLTYLPRLLLTTVLVLVLLLTGTRTTPAQQFAPLARRFDEFGDVQYSDLIARLDNFAVSLQSQPETLGFIVVYRTRRDLAGLSHSLAFVSQDYIVMTRGLQKERLITVDGGVAGCLTQELWIVPRGKTPTPRSDAYGTTFQYSDSAWKFFEYQYDTQEEWTRLGYGRLNNSNPDHLEAYANEVKKNPRYLACLIAYAQYNSRRQMVDHRGDYDPRPATRLDSSSAASK